MLDINFIRENLKDVKQNIDNRRMKVDVDHLLVLDDKRRELQTEIDALRAERNSGSKGKPTPEQIEKMKAVGDKIKKLEEQYNLVLAEFNELLGQVPNMAHPASPIGGEEDFVTLSNDIEPHEFPFQPKDHEQLMLDLDLIDFERGAKVAGSKFYYFKNDMVRMNQALINYGLDTLADHGYTFVETPDLAKNEIIMGAGFNPRGEEKQIYNIQDEELSLVGTAEITMLGYHANEVLDLENGPIKYAALSHCFRTEAGSYGRTSKGLYRVHQFSKLEMFVFCKPEDSDALHEELLNIEKEIMNGLEIPYRVIDIPTGDLGAPAYRKYDIEAWMTMKAENGFQGDYGEVTSTSNCTDYQARRLNIKYKDENGKNQFVHTLNGTAVVLSRFPIAIVENYQQEDGSIKIPTVLQKYMGKDKITNNSQ
jgi:seryl-tRNA synthetase